MPVWKTLQNGLLTIRMERASLARTLVLPAVLVATFLVYLYYRTPTENPEDVMRWHMISGLLTLALGVVWALFAVACHRILLGDPSKPRLLNSIWLGRRQLRYTLMAAVVGLPLVLSYLIFPAIYLFEFVRFEDSDLPRYLTAIYYLVIILPAHYLGCRFVLTLPAAALNRPLSFINAWRMSAGNGWRVTALLLVAPLLSELINLAVDLLRETAPILHLGLGVVLEIAVGVVTIGALSSAYKWISDNHQSEDEKTQAFRTL